MAKRAKTFVPGAGIPADKKGAAAAAPAGAQPTVNGTAPSGQMQQDIEAIKVSCKFTFKLHSSMYVQDPYSDIQIRKFGAPADFRL